MPRELPRGETQTKIMKTLALNGKTLDLTSQAEILDGLRARDRSNHGRSPFQIPENARVEAEECFALQIEGFVNQRARELNARSVVRFNREFRKAFAKASGDHVVINLSGAALLAKN